MMQSDIDRVEQQDGIVTTLLGCSEVRVPGTFVVLQGVPGDGLSNTIDLRPELTIAAMDDDEGVLDNDDGGVHEDDDGVDDTEGGQAPASTATAAKRTTTTTYTLSTPHLPLTTTTAFAATAAAVPGMTMRMQQQQQSQPREQVPAANETPGVSKSEAEAAAASSSSSSEDSGGGDSFIVVSDDRPTAAIPVPGEDPDEQQQQSQSHSVQQHYPLTHRHLSQGRLDATLEEWQTDCRTHRESTRKEWKESLAHRSSTLCLGYECAPWRSCPTTGRLLVLDRLPSPSPPAAGPATIASTSSSLSTSTTKPTKPTPNVLVGTLAPGTTVVATQLVTLHADTLLPVVNRPRIAHHQQQKRRQKQQQQQQQQQGGNGAHGANTTTSTASANANAAKSTTPSAAAAAASSDSGRQPEDSSWLSEEEVAAGVVAHPPGRKGEVQFLKIESPCVGYVCLSVHGYPYLGPGFLQSYVDVPASSLWRVACPVGAFVREGLDLSTHHLATVPFGTLVRVRQKVVNATGLSRLQVEAIVYEEEDGDECDGTAAAAAANPAAPILHAQLVSGSATAVAAASAADVASAAAAAASNTTVAAAPLLHARLVCGWCSEFLNPLSGQRGTILEPLPFPVPALYRVSLADGAVLRSGVELSSPQIGRAPCGSLLSVTGRALTEHPADKCLERLQLAGDGGWVSLRLNKPPPEDSPVVALVGIDPAFDPEAPGSYHVEALLRVRQEQGADEGGGPPSPDRAAPRNLSGNDLSSVDESADSTSTSGSGAGNNTAKRPSTSGKKSEGGCIYSRSACQQLEHRKGRGHHPHDKSGEDLTCLICLAEERTATLVHGETGHIACCLVCARILKARSDPCPVCRLPIDSVIQHFWA